MLTRFSYIFFLIFCLAGFSSQLQAEQKAKIKAVVFDFGGVIAKSDHNEIANFIAKTLHISPNEALESLAELKKKSSEIENEQDFWLAYANSKGIKLPDNWLEKLNETRFQSLKVMPGMIDLVKDLQKQGYQTALLSNVRKSQAQIKRQLGYYELFHPTIFSYEIGVSKPDPKAYYILLDQLKMPPEVVLFIDNKLPNVEVAKSIGMDAIQYVNTDQLIKELKQRGIEVKK